MTPLDRLLHALLNDNATAWLLVGILALWTFSTWKRRRSGRRNSDRG